MEHKFEKSSISCLNTVLQEVFSSEQALEIRIPDGMPDIGRVLAAWGQPIMRGKEWRSHEVLFTGGMMVWVLYTPEDGSDTVAMNGWMPFQMKWDLPEDQEDGNLRICCLPRFVDARSVSPRKLMVRGSMAVQAEAFVPMEQEVSVPGEVPEDIQLLLSTYPVRMPAEAGEKTFAMDEELILPDAAPVPEGLIYYCMKPRIVDKKVLSDKTVFRGNGNLHVLYRSNTGQLHNWDFELPFSQYAQLDTVYGNDAQADVIPAVTNLELELDDDGHMRLKCGITAQYLITDRKMISLVEDAYSPVRELEVETEKLALPAVLDVRRENIYGEQTWNADANLAADVQFLPEFPRQRMGERGMQLEIPGTFQILYYGEDGALHCASARWEGHLFLAADESSQIQAVPLAAEPNYVIGSNQMMAKVEIPLEITATAVQNNGMVTAVESGDLRTMDPNRPTLILRRAAGNRLWDIAKASGSTVDAIRKANGLQEEPAQNQMLLIPVN